MQGKIINAKAQQYIDNGQIKLISGTLREIQELNKKPEEITKLVHLTDYISNERKNS